MLTLFLRLTSALDCFTKINCTYVTTYKILFFLFFYILIDFYSLSRVRVARLKVRFFLPRQNFMLIFYMELILYIVYNVLVTLHKIQNMEDKMASTIVKKSLVLEHDNGMVDGKQRLKKQSYSNIKFGASEPALLATAISINALSQKEVVNTLLNTTEELQG